MPILAKAHVYLRPLKLVMDASLEGSPGILWGLAHGAPMDHDLKRSWGHHRLKELKALRRNPSQPEQHNR